MSSSPVEKEGTGSGRRPVRILAVCIGNIARSPTAAEAIRREAERAGLAVEVDSAGVEARAGSPPHWRIKELAAERGLVVDHRARQVEASDLDRFDIVLAMDRYTADRLRRLSDDPAALAKISLFAPFDPQATSDEVTDPGSDDQFLEVLATVQAAATGLVERLKR